MKLDRRLLHLAQDARLLLAITLLLGAIAGVAAVAQARFLSQIIDRAFLQAADLDQVGALLRWFFFAILVRAAAAYGSDAAAIQVAAQVKQALRQRLFAHLFALGPLHAREERTGELAVVVTEGIDALDAYFSQYLPHLALAVLIPLTILAFVLPRDPLSGVVLFLTAPLIPLFMILIGSLADALTRQQWQTLRRLGAHFFDVLQGLPTLKLFGRSREQIAVIAQISERYRATTMGILRVTFLSALVLELVATISTAVVAVTVGLRLLYGWLPFEQAFFVLLLAPEFYQPLRSLGARFHAGTAGTEAAQRIFALLAIQPAPAGETTAPNAATIDHRSKTSVDKPQTSLSGAIHAASPPTTSEAAPPETRRGPLRSPDARQLPPAIAFEDVSYTYPTARSPALAGLTFTIPAGRITALVGPSGGGKSTIAYLLLRFLEPERGRITLDGAPLSALAADVWRARVAWVPQLPYLFHDTIAANILLARPDASRDAVIAAARLAHAHEFIEALPAGYDTVIGERGARLSGGQAQRLALARAFLKDAPFLILDEASSHLDPEHAAALDDCIQRLAASRTILIIAHRLNTVRCADQIVVIANGRAVETGAHDALLQRNGLYRRLIAAQGDI